MRLKLSHLPRKAGVKKNDNLWPKKRVQPRNHDFNNSNIHPTPQVVAQPSCLSVVSGTERGEFINDAGRRGRRGVVELTFQTVDSTPPDRSNGVLSDDGRRGLLAVWLLEKGDILPPRVIYVFGEAEGGLDGLGVQTVSR